MVTTINPNMYGVQTVRQLYFYHSTSWLSGDPQCLAVELLSVFYDRS
jgi:hypothetical protein